MYTLEELPKDLRAAPSFRQGKRGEDEGMDSSSVAEEWISHLHE